MFAPERKKRIKEIVLEQKQIEVSQLSKILDVSDVTIRRDLEKLEKELFLTRTYGGAFLNEQDDVSLSYSVPKNPEETEEAQIYNEIGSSARYLVEDNASVIIGPGRAGVFIARHLKAKKNLRIITTDLNVIEELTSDYTGNSKMVFIGGDIDPATRQASGPISTMILSNLNVDVAFVEMDGIVIDKGYYVDSYDKATVIDQVMKISKETIAVCADPRFGQTSFFFLNSLGTFKKVLSSAAIPNQFKEYYFDNDIKLYTSLDLLKKI